MFGIPRKGEIDYSQVIELDLASVVPSVSGPKRPQDRIDLPKIKDRFETLFSKSVAEGGYGKGAAEIDRRVGTQLPGDRCRPRRRADRGDHLLHQHVESQRCCSQRDCSRRKRSRRA